MNEELKRELLSLLREIKSVAPGSWQLLVEQRASYCWAVAIMCLIIAIAAAVVGRLMIASARKVEDSIDREFATPIAWAFCLCAFIPLGISVAYIAEGLAPLGRVLEAIR